MNIFITGSGGFIGKHLTKRLEKHHRLFTPGRDFFKKTSDRELNQFFRDHQIEIVIHLATYFVRDHTSSDLAPMIDSNILLGTRILEAMKESPIWFINTGTALQHTGPNHDQPFNLYAATKESFEFILKSFKSPYVTLKLFETYGPFDPRDKVLNLIHRSAKKGEPLNLSPGYQELELAYIDDVVAAYERILELTKNPELIRNKCFAVTGTRVNLRELVTIYESVSGGKVPAHWGTIPYRDNEVMVPWTGFERVPGFQTQFSLEQGILRTFFSEENL